MCAWRACSPAARRTRPRAIEIDLAARPRRSLTSSSAGPSLCSSFLPPLIRLPPSSPSCVRARCLSALSQGRRAHGLPARPLRGGRDCRLAHREHDDRRGTRATTRAVLFSSSPPSCFSRHAAEHRAQHGDRSSPMRANDARHLVLHSWFDLHVDPMIEMATTPESDRATGVIRYKAMILLRRRSTKSSAVR